MSPPPVRFEMKASLRPSGEKIGRDSLAGLDTSKRASPPLAETVQISPPETKAISARSGDNAGSAKLGRGATERPLPWVRARALFEIGRANGIERARATNSLKQFIVSLRLRRLRLASSVGTLQKADTLTKRTL